MNPVPKEHIEKLVEAAKRAHWLLTGTGQADSRIGGAASLGHHRDNPVPKALREALASLGVEVKE